MRNGPRPGAGGEARGAEGRHRRVRRPRRLDGACGAARPRGRPCDPFPVPRAPAPRARAAWRNGGEVHRRRGRRSLRRAGRARRRPRARRPGVARDPGGDRGHERGGSGARAGGSDRRRHRRGARGARRQGRAGGGNGVRRRDEHVRPAPGRGASRRRPRGRDDVPRHRARNRVRGARPGLREGQVRAACRLVRPAPPRQLRDRPGRTGAGPARRAREGARGARRRALPRPGTARARARHPRRGARNRQVAPRAGADADRRCGRGADHVAPGPLAPLRRGRRAVVARGDREGPGGHPRIGRRAGDRREARRDDRLADRRRGRRPLGRAAPAPAHGDPRPGRAGGVGAGGGLRGLAPVRRGARGVAADRARLRRPALGGRRAPRLRRLARGARLRRPFARRLLGAPGAARATARLGWREAQRDNGLARPAVRRGHDEAARSAARQLGAPGRHPARAAPAGRRQPALRGGVRAHAADGRRSGGARDPARDRDRPHRRASALGEGAAASGRGPRQGLLDRRPRRARARRAGVARRPPLRTGAEGVRPQGAALGRRRRAPVRLRPRARP